MSDPIQTYGMDKIDDLVSVILLGTGGRSLAAANENSARTSETAGSAGDHACVAGRSAKPPLDLERPSTFLGSPEG